MKVAGRLAAGLRLGLVAGALLGVLEAVERAWALRAFVAHPVELA